MYVNHWKTVVFPDDNPEFKILDDPEFANVPSYFQVFQPLTSEHHHLLKQGNLNHDFVVDEYDPFLYSDDVTLSYRLIGLKNITVGQESEFTLDTFGKVRLDSREETVRVLFYGISVFSPTWVGDYEGTWKATFQPSDPGLYRVHVQSVYRFNRSVHQFRAIQGSPFTLLVRPEGSERLTESQVIASLPVSRTGEIGAIMYPDAVCVDAHRRPGRWVRCHDTPEPCVRTGWVWVPQTCHYQILRPEEVRRSPRPLWIVFAGSSVQRGSFFSFVDFLLQGKAHNLTTSGFWKCWGWMVSFPAVQWRASSSCCNRSISTHMQTSTLLLHLPRSRSRHPCYTVHGSFEVRICWVCARALRGWFLLHGIHPIATLLTRRAGLDLR